MTNKQFFADKVAIGLSGLCAIHCLVLPLLIVMLPSLASLPLNDERFHLWMVFAVIPISIFALFLGCRRHKNYQVLGFGVVGLVLLVTAILGEEIFGEIGEKGFTLAGAAIIAFGHFRNYRLCQQHDECHKTKQAS